MNMVWVWVWGDWECEEIGEEGREGTVSMWYMGRDQNGAMGRIGGGVVVGGCGLRCVLPASGANLKTGQASPNVGTATEKEAESTTRQTGLVWNRFPA